YSIAPPESQFGMGYTNLMVIIAKIVDYIELYSEKDINGSVNILCIEEPESFMHPQMQELFIKNISKAIATLLGKKLSKKQQLDKFQIIITTHSTHILNSKIQSGNALNNISYLGQEGVNNIIKNISDNAIVSVGDNEKKAYEYIKKYLRL
ncbi:ATP-dependent endonuclease, partial [Streptococcus phocae subsp. salmonis]|uniref:AAA family ATPase n=1 Tax=Streptococcus phocae TaxID=119224 RepID=UPI000531E800